MKLPCETALWYTLPKVRADVTKELISRGLSQKEVAEKLGVTPSAISQYLHKKRGNTEGADENYNKLISEAAEELVKTGDEKVIMKLMCTCCAKARQ